MIRCSECGIAACTLASACTDATRVQCSARTMEKPTTPINHNHTIKAFEDCLAFIMGQIK